jgi:hypothetical protein
MFRVKKSKQQRYALGPPLPSCSATSLLLEAPILMFAAIFDFYDLDLRLLSLWGQQSQWREQGIPVALPGHSLELA